MKIGILTFHRSVNNGAVMQCYALSKRLSEDFPNETVEVIDYHMPKVERGYSPSFRQYFSGSSPLVKLKKAYRLLCDPNMLKKARRRNEIFREALPKLPLSPKYIFSDEVDDLIEYINSRYDVLIVGSDAVWNYVMRGLPNAYFPDERIKCHKLSYAASCYGMDFLKCPDTDKRQIGKILEDFQFIGVRDSATEDFVKWSGCTYIPVHTCDPTAFLDVNDLPIDKKALEEKLVQKGFDMNKPTVGVMGNNKMVGLIRKFYGDRYQIAALYNVSDGADVQLYDLTPYEWAYVFRYFKITFTTYFHGTMLSLRNGVPVICIALETEFAKYHTPKTLDLLQRLGYEDWYFQTDYVSKNIDAIKKKANELIESSIGGEIDGRMDMEAESYDSFKYALSSVINNSGGGYSEYLVVQICKGYSSKICAIKTGRLCYVLVAFLISQTRCLKNGE